MPYQVVTILNRQSFALKDKEDKPQREKGKTIATDGGRYHS